jgi:G3E family GTPase
MSFEQILAVSDRNKTPFDRIVLENSGVAEPQKIREAFTEAMEMGHPVLERIHLSTLVRLNSCICFSHCPVMCVSLDNFARTCAHFCPSQHLVI